jgi:hypothetical protein
MLRLKSLLNNQNEKERRWKHVGAAAAAPGAIVVADGASEGAG